MRVFWILKFNFMTSTRTPMRCWMKIRQYRLNAPGILIKISSVWYIYSRIRSCTAHTLICSLVGLVHCRMLKIEKKKKRCLLTLRKTSRLAQDRMCARCSLNDVTLISYSCTHHSIDGLDCEWCWRNTLNSSKYTIQPFDCGLRW